jgi:hypothetical protein
MTWHPHEETYHISIANREMHDYSRLTLNLSRIVPKCPPRLAQAAAYGAADLD